MSAAANPDAGPARVTIERVVQPTPDFRALIGELDDFLAQHYPPEQRLGLPFDSLFQPDMRVFLGRLDDTAAGCAGVALLDGFAEVKRMYVRPDARGQGVADALLDRLEAEARRAGFPLLMLQTGRHQAAAIQFYRRAGFSECAAFGVYRAMPAAALATSVFLQKRLADEARMERASEP